jgi:hypothetical protein
MPPRRKKRAARKPKEAAPPPVVAAPPVESDETPPSPGPKPRGMTTEQIRRVGDRIAEHERDLKNSTSRR